MIQRTKNGSLATIPKKPAARRLSVTTDRETETEAVDPRDLSRFEGEGGLVATINQDSQSPKKNNWRMSRFSGRTFFWAFSAVLFFCVELSAWAEAPRDLTKSFRPTAQTIPLLVTDSSNAKMTLGWLKLKCESTADLDEVNDGPQFQFDNQIDRALSNSLRSQLWVSALASAIAWQEPWLAVKWTITEIPNGEASGNGAALAIALIASAAGVDYPQDTVVLGRLNPDGSLGAVPHAAVRLQTAAAAEMKKVILSNSQRFETSDQGEIINLPALAEKLGMECVLVDDLIEATEVVLNGKFPTAPSMQNSPRYPIKVLNALDLRCRAEMSQLREESKVWPRATAQFTALKPQDQNLWKKVFESYDQGLDAYRSGQLYLARRLMRQTQAYLAGIAEVRAVGDKFDFKNYYERGNAVRKKMFDRISKSSIDKNELQSALVLAEEGDWIYRLNTSVEGAQIIARQAFDPRSDANLQQKALAQTLLVSAVAGAESQMKEASFYEDVYSLLVSKDEVPIYNRAQVWLPQMQAAQLSAADIFVADLKSRSSEFGENLLFDARLSGFERALRDDKITWEQQQHDREVAVEAKNGQPKITKVGFTPGEGYVAPKPLAPPPQVQSFSDAALCLNWVNEYCEVAVLQEKYLRLGASFDSNMMEWNIKNSAELQGMLQVADLGARRGIIFAEKVGVDTSILDLIYEVASNLRLSEDSNLRLEALRQYWRCSLLGSMCWQLGYIPKAVADNSAAVIEPTSIQLPTPTPMSTEPAAPVNTGRIFPPPFVPAIPYQ